MQEPFCASRNKYANTWNCLPLPARFHFTARACLWGVKGINSSHKIFQVACHHLSCALCKWKQGAWYLPASVSHTLLIDEKLTQTDCLELLKNASVLLWRIFNIFYQNWDLEIALDTGIYQKEKATAAGASGFPYSKQGIVPEGASILQALPEQPRFQEAARSLASTRGSAQLCPLNCKYGEDPLPWTHRFINPNETFPSSIGQALPISWMRGQKPELHSSHLRGRTSNYVTSGQDVSTSKSVKHLSNACNICYKRKWSLALILEW